jgi:hypothetical protein
LAAYILSRPLDARKTESNPEPLPDLVSEPELLEPGDGWEGSEELVANSVLETRAISHSYPGLHATRRTANEG